MFPTSIRQLLLQAYKKIDVLDAELLLAHALNKPREWVLAHKEQKINKAKKQKITYLIRQRTKGVPLAYLTGKKEFFGLDFEVDKNVLIPRPETEMLVSLALDRLRTTDYGLRIILVDVGTGSGCIPIAITKALKHFSTRSPKIFAIDISKKALRVARRNAKKHRAKIKFLRGDLLKPITSILHHYTTSSLNKHKKNTKQILKKYYTNIIITANLPYLTNEQYKKFPSIRHEPRQALVVDEKDGLSLYKKLFKQIQQLTSDYRLRATVFCEIDPSQSKSIQQMVKKYLPSAEIEIKKDLAGRDRTAIISNFKVQMPNQVRNSNVKI